MTEADRPAASPGEADDVAEAIRRAEAAVRRAETELERTREAAARVRARAALRTARGERVATARHATQTVDSDEFAWRADRRDFVAAERDSRADERDDLADRREGTAGLRERLADEREHELLDREQRFTRRRPSGRPAAALLRAGQDREDGAAHAEGERRRERAASDRRVAARDRARAAAQWGPETYGPKLSTRDVIGQAKGILIERQHLSAGDAFDLLRRVSQRLNRRLADVAQQLAEAGELPT